MSTKRRLTSIFAGAAVAIGLVTSSTANEIQPQNFGPSYSLNQTELAQDENTRAFPSYNAVSPYVTLAQNVPSVRDIANAAIYDRNARLVYEVASMVYGAAYVELDTQEITALLWASLPQADILQAGFDPNVVPVSVQGFFETFESIYTDVLLSQNTDFGVYTTAMISEFLANIDAHSLYHPPQQYGDVMESSSGSFGGVGITMQRDPDTGYIRILGFANMIGDSPAETAGALENDIITHVDDMDISDMEFEDISEAIKGTPGTTVNFTVQREGVADPVVVTIERAVIARSPVTSEVLENGQIGHISLSSFTAQSDRGIMQAIEEMEASDTPPTSYILDLRGNPGGLLTQARAVADIFLESGNIVSERHRNGQTEGRMATPGDMINGKPLVVLINSGSASASEIVSGALQHFDRATIVGTTSFGKGSVQSIMPLRINGGGLRLTTALYMIDGNKSVQNHGVEPDIAVDFGVAAMIDEYRRNEADQRNAIVNESTTDQFIEDDDLVCVLAGDRDETIASLSSDYILTRADGAETAIDSSLLCAVEHLLNVETHTQRVLEDLPVITQPAVVAPVAPRP